MAEKKKRLPPGYVNVSTKLLPESSIEEEMKVFEQAKTNRNVLYNYLKKKNKTKQKIGPLKDGKNILEEHSSITLTKQYEKVYSIPKKEYIINDLDVFFMNKCVPTHT